MNHFKNLAFVRSPGAASRTRKAFRTACLLLGVSVAAPALAQEPVKAPPAPETKEIDNFSFPEEESGSLAFPETATNHIQAKIPNPDKVDRASGVDGSIGFIGLKAFGRDDSIVPVELFPYLQMDNQILFGDIRGFLTTDGKVGVNAGAGFRFIEPNEIALFGVNGFYDSDDSTGRSYQQMSVGWEARTKWAGLFGNVYMPIGTTEKTISQSIIDPRFDENNILFDVRSQVGKAMTGLDLNFQAYLPGDFFETHQVRATAGWYHFQGGGDVDDINGYKLQMQGNIVPAIGTLTSLTHDGTYGTRFNIGVFWQFGTRQLPGNSLQGQLRKFVDRNYNVILSRKTSIQSDVVARNADGSELIVQHVGTNTGTGTGTYNNPFTSLTGAQNAAQAADIIFVHSGTTVNDGIVLADNQSLVGEGAAFRVQDSSYGWFNLPGATGGGVNSTTSPQIFGAIGDAITMGNNSQVSGIRIVNSTGKGIVAKDVDNVKISDVIVENAGGNAVELDGVTDSSVSNVTISGGSAHGLAILNIDDVLELSDIYIQDVTGDGVHIDGGLGTIKFTDELVIRRTGGAGFLAQNMEALTEVDDKGTTSTLDDVTTITPSVISVEQLVIDNSGGGHGAGLVTQDNGGLIGFGQVDIKSEGAAAVYSRNDNGLLIGNGILSSKNGAVADIEGSSVSVALTSIEADGGAFAMRFKDATGSFKVFGDGATNGSGGEIKNTTTAILMENAGSVALQTVDFTDNGTLATVNTAANLTIAGSSITGTTNTFIDATNLTMLQVYQSTFVDNTITSGTGISFKANTEGSFSATVSNNIVTALPGTFVSVKALAGAETSSLTYAFQANAVDLSTSANTAASNVDWSGPLLAYATQNTIVGSGTSQTGIRFTTGDTSSLGQIQASYNKIEFQGTNSIGMDFNHMTPMTIIADGNELNLKGANQTAIRASLGKASAIAMAENIITDYAGGGTGILFSSIEDGSQLAIDANTIDLSRFSTFVDRGIIVNAFTAADGDPPIVQFISTGSNKILGATTAYSVPTTGAQGRLLINDAAVVFP